MHTTTQLDLTTLDDQVIGPVLRGGEPDAVTEAATFNLAVSHTPAVVVGAVCAEDVATTVAWAAERGLAVAVQATGHGVVAPVRDAVLVTTSRMSAVSIDPVLRTARVEAGVRWREVIDAAARHGLAPLCGSSSQVGVVGYTLGGGVGLLAREYGFAADLVTALTVATADGRLRHVDADHEPDLFWAVRGGKGNFGVVTDLEFGLVPVTTVVGGSVFYDADGARDVLQRYRAWSAGLPERCTTSVAILRLPPLDSLPEPLRGRTVVHLRYAHHGDEAEGTSLLAPMLEGPGVVMQVSGEMPFVAVDAIHQDPTDPMPVWERGTLLRELTGATIDRLLDVVGPRAGAPLAMVEVRQLGGALGRPAPVPNAVPGREGAYAVLALGVLAPEIAAVVPAVGNALVDALAPWSTGTALLNWLGSGATPDQVARAWAPEVHARLLAVKDDVDPDNLFRTGHALR